MTTFWFVRHAVTAHTGKKLSGWMDGIGLTAEGLAQAQVTADALAQIRIDAIYSSPLDRTLQTARAIARPHGLNVKTSKALGEVEYGRWTNKSLKVLARTKLWTQVQQWPSSARFPDGESIQEVQTRAVAEVERLAEEHVKGSICCVSHGDVIKLVLAHFLGVHIDLYQRIEVGPGSISAFALGRRPTIFAVNVRPQMFTAQTPAEVAQT